MNKEALEKTTQAFNAMCEVLRNADKDIRESMNTARNQQIWQKGGPSDFRKRGGKNNVKFKSR